MSLLVFLFMFFTNANKLRALPSWKPSNLRRTNPPLKIKSKLFTMPHKVPGSIFTRLQARCHPELQSSQGLTETGGSTSKTAHSHGQQVDTGFWQGLSSSPHESLHSIAWVFSWHGGRLPPEQMIQGSTRRKSQCLLQPNLGSHILSLSNIL